MGRRATRTRPVPSRRRAPAALPDLRRPPAQPDPSGGRPAAAPASSAARGGTCWTPATVRIPCQTSILSVWSRRGRPSKLRRTAARSSRSSHPRLARLSRKKCSAGVRHAHDLRAHPRATTSGRHQHRLGGALRVGAPCIRGASLCGALLLFSSVLSLYRPFHLRYGPSGRRPCFRYARWGRAQAARDGFRHPGAHTGPLGRPPANARIYPARTSWIALLPANLLRTRALPLRLQPGRPRRASLPLRHGDGPAGLWACRRLSF